MNDPAGLGMWFVQEQGADPICKAHRDRAAAPAAREPGRGDKAAPCFAGPPAIKTGALQGAVRRGRRGISRSAAPHFFAAAFNAPVVVASVRSSVGVVAGMQTEKSRQLGEGSRGC